jgi:GNAT superfamily N-acetyltransferase
MTINKKPGGYTIEAVNPTEDAEAYRQIVRMHLSTFPDDLMENPDSDDWFIAYKGATPVAFAGMCDLVVRKFPWPKKKIKVEGVALLSRAGVLPSHRGHGLQRDLIAARVARAREIGKEEVWTTTYDNPQSGNNLIAMGFRLFVPPYRWGASGTNYWKFPLKD